MSGIATTQIEILKALKSGEKIALDDLAANLPFERRFIVNAAGRLITNGMIERTELGVYRITMTGYAQLESGEPIRSGKKGKRSGVRRVRAGGLRQRIWNAMRQHCVGGQSKAFSLPDLLTIALNPDEETHSTYNNAGQYIRQLKKTGYLLTLTRRQPGTKPGSNGFTLYKLVRDNGERSPVVRIREKTIYDPNTGEVFKW